MKTDSPSSILNIIFIVLSNNVVKIRLELTFAASLARIKLIPIPNSFCTSASAANKLILQQTHKMRAQKIRLEKSTKKYKIIVFKVTSMSSIEKFDQ